MGHQNPVVGMSQVPIMQQAKLVVGMSKYIYPVHNNDMMPPFQQK